MMDKDGFIAAVVGLWKDHACMDIDGADFQDALLQHGLATEVPATKADCETEVAQDWDVEPGDLMLKYDAELLAIQEIDLVNQGHDNAALRTALEENLCPFPVIKNKTVGACVAGGHCGCGNRVALGSVCEAKDD